MLCNVSMTLTKFVVFKDLTLKTNKKLYDANEKKILRLTDDSCASLAKLLYLSNGPEHPSPTDFHTKYKTWV